ncbi:MAG TPA: flagellar biosynthetic protein FliO [Anaerolineaceae bacterium]
MEAIQQMVAVMAVMGLLGAALYCLRGRGWARWNGFNAKTRPGRKMELIERLQVGPQHSLLLVRVADRALVVGLSPGGCTLIERTSWNEAGNIAGPSR